MIGVPACESEVYRDERKNMRKDNAQPSVEIQRVSIRTVATDGEYSALLNQRIQEQIRITCSQEQRGREGVA